MVFPISNPASCWDVDVREDGRSRRLFRGPRRLYSLSLGSPICDLGVHRPVGGRPRALPPEFIYGSSRILLFWLFLSTPPACVCRVQLASAVNVLV